MRKPSFIVQLDRWLEREGRKSIALTLFEAAASLQCVILHMSSGSEDIRTVLLRNSWEHQPAWKTEKNDDRLLSTILSECGPEALGTLRAWGCLS